MFKATAMKSNRRKNEFCLYLDKFHCLLVCEMKQHKMFYEEQFINQHSGSPNHEGFLPPRWWRRRKRGEKSEKAINQVAMVASI